MARQRKVQPILSRRDDEGPSIAINERKGTALAKSVPTRGLGQSAPRTLGRARAGFDAIMFSSQVKTWEADSTHNELPHSIGEFVRYRDQVPRAECKYRRIGLYRHRMTGELLDVFHQPKNLQVPLFRVRVRARPGRLLGLQTVELVEPNLCSALGSPVVISDVELCVDFPFHEITATQLRQQAFEPRARRSVTLVDHEWAACGSRRSNHHTRIYDKREQGRRWTRFEKVIRRGELRKRGADRVADLRGADWEAMVRTRFVEVDLDFIKETKLLRWVRKERMLLVGINAMLSSLNKNARRRARKTLQPTPVDARVRRLLRAFVRRLRRNRG